MTEFKINAIEKCTKDLIDKGFIEKMKANGDIVYTETFYKEMNRLMNSGKSSVEAYAELGFDSDVFGVNRAMQAGKNARNRARAGYRFTPCNGTVPPSQVEELASMSVEEQLDYFISRNIYLETLLEEIKKKRSDVWR